MSDAKYWLSKKKYSEGRKVPRPRPNHGELETRSFTVEKSSVRPVTLGSLPAFKNSDLKVPSNPGMAERMNIMKRTAMNEALRRRFHDQVGNTTSMPVRSPRTAEREIDSGRATASRPAPSQHRVFRRPSDVIA